MPDLSWAQVAGLWPLLLLPALLAVAPWVRRREWVRAARRHWRAHPTIAQASHDRADEVQPPEEET